VNTIKISEATNQNRRNFLRKAALTLAAAPLAALADRQSSQLAAQSSRLTPAC
jgi:hypothetical protein